MIGLRWIAPFIQKWRRLPKDRSQRTQSQLYAGRLVAYARLVLKVIDDIVRKPERQRTFEVLPRRWVVERTPPWISRCRRLAHDYERLPEHSEAMVKWAMIGLMTRRLARHPSGAHGSPAQAHDCFSNTF